MKKLRIHVINKYFYPVAAGIEINALNTYDFMAKKGWDITVHTSRDTLNEKNVLSNFEKINGLNVKRYQFGKFGFNHKINWENTDILILHNFDMFPHFFILFNCFIKKILGRKKFSLILSTHGGLTPDWRTFPRRIRIIKKTYHKTLGVFLINKTVDGVRAVSDWEKGEIKKLGVHPNLITVINNGVEDDSFLNLEKLASKRIKSLVSENKPYIIQIGRIHPIKNYETAITALAESPNLNYLIAGPDQDTLYRMKLENIVKELKLEKRVKFLGVIRGVDKYYLIKNAELMAHMATCESFCNAVHEGMSQGLVCIVSNRTALPYLVKDGVNGFVLDAYNHEALAKKIKFVLENKNSPEIKAMQKRNIQFAKNHSWENVAKKVERFYLEILTQK